MCQNLARKILERQYEEGTEDHQLSYTLVSYLMRFANTSGMAESVSDFLQSKAVESVSTSSLQDMAEHKWPGADDPVTSIGMEYSFSDWMVQKFIESFGIDGTRELCSSFNETAPITIRVNLLKTSVGECQKKLEEEGIETTPTRFSPFGLTLRKRINVFQLKAFREGYFEVQDEGSQLLPLLIDPKPTDKVLDACAGAGGKTLELAALMKNRGEILASDLNEFRIVELKKRARRAGAFNIRTKRIDFSKEVQEMKGIIFDKVLVDAPCSGIGTIRRNPGMKWSVTPETVKEISQKQLSILSQAARFVKKGAKLFYATCTLFRDENEAVVDQFVSKHNEFIVIDPTPILERTEIPHQKNSTYIYLMPHLHGTDAFFCAILERTA